MAYDTEDKIQVLIADDSALNREILKNILEERYTVVEASSGQEAMDLMQDGATEFGALLLDLNMPGKDGFEVLKWMNRESIIERLPVIVISAENQAEYIAEAYDLGAVDYFSRPYDSFTVMSRLTSILRLYKKYEDLLRIANHLIYVVDIRSHRILYATDSFCQNYHVSRKEIYTKKCSDVICHGENTSEDMCAARIAVNSRQPFIFYDKKVKKYYQIDARQIKWGQKDAYSIGLLDVTNLMRMNNENNTLIRNSVDSFLTLNTKMGGIAHLNLTLNMSYETEGDYYETLLDGQSGSADEVFEIVRKSIVSDEEREQFVTKFNRESLIRSFHKGETKVTFECKGSLEGKYDFVLRIIASLYRNALTGNIEAFLYTVDMTDDYLDKQILKCLYTDNYDLVGAVNLDRHSIYTRRKYEKRADRFVMPNERYCSYESFFNDLVGQYFSGMEKERILEKLSIDKVRENMLKYNEYATAVQYTKDGYHQMAKVQFRWIDKEDKSVIVTLEDATSDAEKDLLTGSYNRMGLFNKAKALIGQAEHPSDYALLYFNFKDFKAINHLLGIEGGDWVLKQFTKRLEESFLHPLVLARIEADRFACLFEKKYLDEKKLQEFCSQRMDYLGKTVKVQILAGIYLLDDKSRGMNERFDNAKIAVEHIADAYIKPYEFFKDEMRDKYISESEVTSIFDTALKNGEFAVFYQPVVNAQTGKIVSAEALVRWKYKGVDLYFPGTFIPALEKNGQISQLDFFVMKEVRRFQEQRHVAGKRIVPVSINLSWMDFYDTEMINWVLKDIEESDIPENIVRFEITETSYAAIAKNRSDILEKMKELGIKLLLDDFGSGYSFFSMLENYDFDILKLDMGFIRKIESSEKARIIIKSMIQMAHRMHITTIAEGAENDAQVQFLRENECDYIQGYYFSKPVPEEEFVKKLEEE